MRTRACVHCTLHSPLSSLSTAAYVRSLLSRRGRVKGFTGRCVLRLSRVEAQRDAHPARARARFGYRLFPKRMYVRIRLRPDTLALVAIYAYRRPRLVFNAGLLNVAAVSYGTRERDCILS